MNSRKIAKIGSALLIIATIVTALSVVLGVSIPNATYSEANTGLSATVSNILGVVSFICYAAAVILLVMLGIRYMTAAPDGKAEFKKMAVLYVVGAVLVFGAGVVLQLIQNVTKTNVQA